MYIACELTFPKRPKKVRISSFVAFGSRLRTKMESGSTSPPALCSAAHSCARWSSPPPQAVLAAWGPACPRCCDCGCEEDV